MKKATLILMAVAAVAVVAATGAEKLQASVINVKFESGYSSFTPNQILPANTAPNTSAYASAFYVGQGVLSDPGNNYWNPAPYSASYTVAGAVASDGVTVTPVRVAVGGGMGFVDFSGPTSTQVQALLGTYTDGGGAISITGLPVNTNYSLYLYAANSATTFAITGGTADGGLSATAPAGDTAFGAEGSNWVLFTGNTGASGQVVGTYASQLDALQISYGAPEPVSLTLLGLGGLALLRRRARS